MDATLLHANSITLPSKSVSLYPTALRLHQRSFSAQWSWLIQKPTTSQSAQNKCQWSVRSQMGHLCLSHTHTLEAQGPSQKEWEIRARGQRGLIWTQQDATLMNSQKLHKIKPVDVP